MTYRSWPIRPPWSGVISEMPPPGDPSAFDDIVNYFIKAGRIQTRPRFNNLAALPDTAPYAFVSFEDQLALWHNLLLTNANAYFVTPGPAYNLLVNSYNAVSSPGSFPGPFRVKTPYSLIPTTQNEVFFCNGGFNVSYVDGGVDLSGKAVHDAGDVPGGCQFLELDPSGDHIIGANWTEPIVYSPGGTVSGLRFPYRIRWCASGNPLEWDPNVDQSAGFVDLFEVANFLSGLATIGAITYVFHDMGLDAMYNTGNGASPFAFENISRGETARTNFYPNTLAKNDNYGVFGGKDDIYTIASSVPTPIGGANRSNIMRDLGQSNSPNDPVGFVTEFVRQGYPFRAYWLTIPAISATWVFDFTYNVWEKFSSSVGVINFMNEVYTQ